MDRPQAKAACGQFTGTFPFADLACMTGALRKAATNRRLIGVAFGGHAVHRRASAICREKEKSADVGGLCARTFTVIVRAQKVNPQNIELRH